MDAWFPDCNLNIYLSRKTLPGPAQLSIACDFSFTHRNKASKTPFFQQFHSSLIHRPVVLPLKAVRRSGGSHLYVLCWSICDWNQMAIFKSWSRNQNLWTANISRLIILRRSGCHFVQSKHWSQSRTLQQAAYINDHSLARLVLPTTVPAVELKLTLYWPVHESACIYTA